MGFSVFMVAGRRTLLRGPAPLCTQRLQLRTD